MKKMLRFVGMAIVICVALVYLSDITYRRRIEGLFDTRFWSNSGGWSEFYSGVYVGGVDIEPGNYDVQVRGGLKYGDMSIYSSYEDFMGERSSRKLVIFNENDDGFHFSIRDGECIEIDVNSINGMRIRKTGDV